MLERTVDGDLNVVFVCKRAIQVGELVNSSIDVTTRDQSFVNSLEWVPSLLVTI